MTEFKEKFIAYIDILGFKKLTEAAEKGTGPKLSELLEYTKILGATGDKEGYKRYGITTCPESETIETDIDYQITQVSDCAVISVEISPGAIINLVSSCWTTVLYLLRQGLMCRGYITRGTIYHNGEQVVGTGYQEAYERERGVSAFKRNADERGTPFVEIDKMVTDYISDNGDDCVKKMFERFVKRDGDVSALFPFKRLSHSFLIGGIGVKFDPKREKESNNNIRIGILEFKKRIQHHIDTTNEDAVRKSEHYLSALDKQLNHCDETDRIIDDLCKPFLTKRIIDLFKPDIDKRT
ncbi:MAG: hypothetical protein U5O15_09085 [Candidatus Krumholzibacteriota bacterium]|nr:hypothetical protein [Candidatus Krumholzibacteriota bacterium]